MSKLVLSIAVAIGLMVGFSGPAGAQAPPMDMSWAIQQQMMLQQQGDLAARQAAMAYYNQMLRLRMMGYTGPSLPTGVTPQSLQNSINQLNNSYQSYNQSAMQNSNRTSRAIQDYDLRAIRGCYLVNNYGTPHYVCPR